ncbi:MAG: NUDIX domain-containing protein [Candidatus Pacebacteria bacterium]|nr:NUDIX domain-containing protein [Candidatus Paceibacterota bacterium]
MKKSTSPTTSPVTSPTKTSKKITCQDIKGKTYSVPLSKLRFRPAVYGVIIENDQVLLSKQWDGYDFPGGAVELGEGLETALIREVKEETGLDIKPGKIIHAEHSFFKLPYSGDFVQSIHLYYQCQVKGGELSTKFFDEHEKKYADLPEWIKLSQVSQYKIYSSVDPKAVLDRAKVG